MNKSESLLTNFAKRVYNIEKFEGVKIVEDETETFAVIAVKIEKKNLQSSSLNTIANMRAKSYLSKFQNGSYMTSEIIMISSSNDSIMKQPISNEVMKEYSSGFAKGLGSLAVLEEVEPGVNVYLFYSKLSK